MNILEKIIQHKQEEVKERSKVTPLERIQDSQRLFAIRDFYSALQKEDIQVIAEIKQKSPSMGEIMLGFDPAEIAQMYVKNGAAAISILTDQEFFGGNVEFIQQVKSVVDIPILRKDFIISEYQVWESFQTGADAILLIADAIDFSLLTDLYSLSRELGLHVLIETHDSNYVRLISDLKSEIVGINCRDLKTMTTDLSWFGEIINELPSNCLKVAESGIKNHSDLNYVFELGYNAALVGTSLMETGEPGVALSHLLQRDII